MKAQQEKIASCEELNRNRRRIQNENENIATCKSENEVVQYIKRVQQGKNIYKSPQ